MPPQTVKFWQWPNLLGLDAAAIACAWMAVFAARRGTVSAPGAAAYLVLGSSVWLTYMADRLLDARPRPLADLLALRHRFAKQNQPALWGLWSLTLLATAGTALATLTRTQLQMGATLLLAALTYTALNLCWSKYFFPKEFLVAALFAAGTQVFLPNPKLDLSVLVFTLICLGNCLAIADKERTVDARLRTRSLALWVSASGITLLLLAAALLALDCHPIPALLGSALCLTLVFLLRHRLPTETYRVLCDASLLVGPAVELLLHYT